MAYNAPDNWRYTDERGVAFEPTEDITYQLSHLSLRIDSGTDEGTLTVRAVPQGHQD